MTETYKDIFIKLIFHPDFDNISECDQCHSDVYDTWYRTRKTSQTHPIKVCTSGVKRFADGKVCPRIKQR